MKEYVAVLLVATSLPLSAQWLNHPDPRTPRTKDGKPNLAAPAPRLNGKPDLSGLWQAERTPEREYTNVLGNGFVGLQVDLHDINKFVLNVLWGLKPEEEPLTPEGAAVYKRHQATPQQWAHTQCLPASIPADMFVMTFKMMQTPQVIVMLTELNSPPRQIYTDGRSLPKDPAPTWMGYAAGKWQGDTLVVESAGYNDQTWLDASGHPHSESLRMTERYRRRDVGHLDVEMTFDDPKMYDKPFTVKLTHLLQADTDILEYLCTENEKDRVHLPR